MGRPLNKKYFGNRNIGSSSTTSDNGIGGQGIASVVLNAKGSYTTRPTVTFPAPDISGGVTATATITSEVNTAAAANGLSGNGYVVGDLITFAGVTGVVARVATVGSGQGEIQAIDFTGTGTSRGSFGALPSATGLAITVIGSVSGGVGVGGSTGSGQTANLTFRALSVDITDEGSGYITAPTGGSLTFTQSVSATSVTLTTDTGAVGSDTNDENAILVTAATTTTTPRDNSDIVKQQGSHSYIVSNSDGVARCSLVAKTPDTAGTCAITATDSDNGTYWVTKLTARKARLTPNTGLQFADGVLVPWTFGTASEGYSVKINNG